METLFTKLFNKIVDNPNYVAKRFRDFGKDMIVANIKCNKYAIVRDSNTNEKKLRIYPLPPVSKRATADISMWIAPYIIDVFKGTPMVINYKYRVGEKVVAYVAEKEK